LKPKKSGQPIVGHLATEFRQKCCWIRYLETPTDRFNRYI